MLERPDLTSFLELRTEVILTFGTSYGALDVSWQRSTSPMLIYIYRARLLRNLKFKPKWPVNLSPVNLNVINNIQTKVESPQVDLNARAHVSHFDAHVSHESCTRFTWTPRTFHMDAAHVSHGTPHMFLQSVESANKAIRTPVIDRSITCQPRTKW